VDLSSRIRLRIAGWYHDLPSPAGGLRDLGNELLGDDPSRTNDSCARPAIADAAEYVNDAVHGLRSGVRVKRGEGKMPVSAMVRAASMVSRSRISPISRHQGPAGGLYFSASLKDLVSAFTSRWLTRHFCEMQILDGVLDGDHVFLAFRVDLVDHRGERRRFSAAGRPVTRMSPRGFCTGRDDLR